MLRSCFEKDQCRCPSPQSRESSSMTAFVLNPCGVQLTRLCRDAYEIGGGARVSTKRCSPLLSLSVSPISINERISRTTRLGIPGPRRPTQVSIPYQPQLAHGNNFGNSHSGGNSNNWGDDKGGNGGDPNPDVRFAAALFARRRFPEVPEWRGNRSRLEVQLERWLAQIRISHLLLAINVAVFVVQVLYGPGLMVRGAKVNSAIAAGEFHRFFSPMFLHASMTHLLVNSFSLHSTGPSVESWFGKKRFIALYMISGICGNILSYMCTPTPAVGASGAIFGLVGATAVILARHRRLIGPRARRGLQSLAYIVVMNFGMGLAPGSRIDNFGHLGGFLGGIAYSYLCGPRMVVRRGRAGKLLLMDVPVLSDAVRDARIRLRQMKKLLTGR